MKNVCIVHYNTPELTTAVIKSVLKHTPCCKITVFDNSDKHPLPDIDYVTILDNTKGQIIDFDKWLAKYPRKLKTVTNWGSEKHIISVEYLYNYYHEGFVLLDSDALVKKDISCFFDKSMAWIGEVEYQPKFRFQAQRVYPFLLWINVEICREYNIHFASEGRIYKVSHNHAPYYDTGGSFYWDCKNSGLPYKEICISDYIEHLGEGSHHRSEEEIKNWLYEHRDLYE